MIILLDQDGVLADFDAGMKERLSVHAHFKPYLEAIDNRRGFEIEDLFPEVHKQAVRRLYHEPNFFLNLPPVPGAVDAYHELLLFGHEIIICTTPLTDYSNCIAEKYAWVEKYFGFEATKRIVLTKDKTLVRGAILIDDKPDIKGLLQPTWRHYLYDRPYNRHSKQRRLTWENYKTALGF